MFVAWHSSCSALTAGEGLDMNATWIPVGSAIGIALLSLAVLDVMSEGPRVDGSSSIGAWTSLDAHAAPTLQDTTDDLLPLELARPAGRETGYAER
jgi:hypothetical protein